VISRENLLEQQLREKEVEIKRLKEEYMMLQNASDKVEEEKDREIERLQDLCNKYEKEHKTTYEIWKKDIYLYNSLVDRIDKAIEYIEENEVVDYNPTLDGSEDDSYMKLPRSLSLFNEGLDILLDILKGVDKE
jgi:sugar-specific transcriptional regulator TrmB